MTHRLPDGTNTRSDKAYVDAWRGLRNDLAAALGGESSGINWDPDVTVRLGGVDVRFPASAALAVLRHLNESGVVDKEPE